MTTGCMCGLSLFDHDSGLCNLKRKEVKSVATVEEVIESVQKLIDNAKAGGVNMTEQQALLDLAKKISELADKIEKEVEKP